MRATRDWLTPPAHLYQRRPTPRLAAAPRGEPKRETDGWRLEGRTGSSDSSPGQRQP